MTWILVAEDLVEGAAELPVAVGIRNRICSRRPVN